MFGRFLCKWWKSSQFSAILYYEKVYYAHQVITERSQRYATISYTNRKECDFMKKQNVGFAFLLLGIIFAVSQDTLFWWIGALFGIIGFIIVLCNSKKDN